MQVKICCISSIEEAQLAINYGAQNLGLVSQMPSGPGAISEDLITEIIATVPDHINSFLLTSETIADKIIKQAQKIKPTTIQLVDTVDKSIYARIRKAIPKLKIVQVLHVLDEAIYEEVRSLEDNVDMFLLDSGNPNKKIKELGGTGKTHNWEISAGVVKISKVPVFLAGGLNSENVAQATRKVKPYGVDLCSGVRTNGKLDELKLDSFMSSVRH